VIIIEFSIVPLGVGISVSKFVAEAVKVLEEEGVNYKLTPMCTIFEVDSIDRAFEIIAKAHKAVINIGAQRVLTSIKIDDRRDIERKMDDKVKSVMVRLKSD